MIQLHNIRNATTASRVSSVFVPFVLYPLHYFYPENENKEAAEVLFTHDYR